MATIMKRNIPIPVQVGIPGLRIGPDDTVVDIGCGMGAICRYAGSFGATVIGIDSEPGLVEQADELMQGGLAKSWRGIVSDCDPIPLPDQMATHVFCTEVLEHVDNPAAFVSELVRIGRPGALYYISVPDPVSENLIRHVAPEWYWQAPFHRRVFLHDQLDLLLREGGLQINQREQGGSYQPIRWLLWWTLGRTPYDLAEESPLIQIWDRLWHTMMSSPYSSALLCVLEETLPKSQIVLASKPGARLSARLRSMIVFQGFNRFKRLIRSGEVRIGGLSLAWSLSRRRDAKA